MIGKIEETKERPHTVDVLPEEFWLARDRHDEDWYFHGFEPTSNWDTVHRIRLTQPDFAALAKDLAHRPVDFIEFILRERLG